MNTEDKKTDNAGNDTIHSVSHSYCVKRHMFFSVTDPVVEGGLTEEEANKLCSKLNNEELDRTYVFYQVHNCC